MKIGIINYGAGNLKSICNALSMLNKNFGIISAPEELLYFDKIIFPGVGAAGNAMKKLKVKGFINRIKKIKKPFLGICLGSQLLADFSEENNTKCFGIIPGVVKRFKSSDLKIPQIGWNKVEFKADLPLFKGIKNGSYFYFVNSYYLDISEKFVFGTTDYGVSFPAVIQKKNFYGVQFHPEKSGEAGLELLSNFCEKC